MRFYPVLGFSLLFSGALLAQEPAFTCRTNEPALLEQLHQNDPVVLEAMAQAKAELEAWTAQFNEGSRSTYTVPVVFHVIHNNGPENISDEQIHDAMRILNEDFNRENGDWDNVRPEFLSLVADIDIGFALATRDPQGNCTKGITRTQSVLTNDGTQDMKDLIQWPRNKYLNVWVCANADGAGGYTLTPGSAAFFSAADGIVMNHQYVGSIGTGTASRSRALTHEVGHWINLEHTWGGSNNPAVASNCSTDDGVSDTPNTIGWTTCNLNGATCGSPLDNVENYMEYSYCSKMFTLGQRTRMIAALTSSTAQRNQLITSGNLAATGVSLPATLCAAQFQADNRLICAGGSVTFEDISYNAVTGRTWDFTGGEPATSTSANPTVTYNSAGIYPVSMTATDGTTSLTNTQNAYITVLPMPGGAVPLVEGFESVAGLNGPEWFTVNSDNDNTFGVTSIASYSGSKSVRIVNSTAMNGRTDELVSTTYDMSGATSISVTFRYAYAKRTSSSDDVLNFYISNNCGDSWSLRKILRGSTTLTTGGTTTASFAPNGPAQWGYAEVTNISSSSFVPGFRVKFEFISDGGNNLYLDDININGAPVSVEEIAGLGEGLVVVPNPVSGPAQLRFTASAAAPASLEILDMTGRVIVQRDLGNLSAGAHSIELPTTLGVGAYFARLRGSEGALVSRFVIR